MKHVKNEIDVTTWSLDAVENAKELFGKLMLDAACETLKCAFEEEGTTMSLRGLWDNSINDPLTMNIRLPLTQDDQCEPVEYSCSLRNIVMDDIEDGINISGFKRVSDALKALAADIDKVIEDSE